MHHREGRIGITRGMGGTEERNGSDREGTLIGWRLCRWKNVNVNMTFAVPLKVASRLVLCFNFLCCRVYIFPKKSKS